VASPVAMCASGVCLATLDPAAGSVVAASIAAFVGVLVYFLGSRHSALERKRDECARAIADALAWLELPYRIRRRQDDSGETLAALAQRLHDLHERLLFHENWLRVELPGAEEKYRALVGAVKLAAVQALQEAWTSPPVSEPAGMNIGDLQVETEHVDSAVRAFSDELKRRLVIWRFWV